MKKYFLDLVREHFSFSAKEKRGMLVLAGILFCLLAFREIYARYDAGKPLSIEADHWAAGIRFLESDSGNTHRTIKPSFTGFYFDPNTITEAEMLLLGLSPKQAAAWQRFRNAGAIFRKPEDVKKLFFMDEERYALWEPWIRIEGSQEKEESKPSPAYTHRARVFASIQLNSCDSNELISIHGIGAFTASKVLRYRNWLGGFVSHEQLSEIKGLRQEQIDTLIKYTRIDAGLIDKIAINSATEAQLQQHPYIRYKAKVICRYRTQHGAFKQPEDLLSTGVIDEVLLEKIRPYLDLSP